MGWLLSLTVGVVLLYLGAEALVRGSAALALRWGATPLLVGITIVAFGTSTPELAVSLRGAYAGESGLALGNIIGSNIANLLLVLGLAALIRPIHVERNLVRREIPWLLLSTVALVFMLVTPHINRWEGAILLLGGGGLVHFTARSARREVATRAAPSPDSPSLPPRWAGVLLGGGLVVLLVGSRLFVDGAIGGAQRLGWPPYLIGLTLVAVGTSLPEIATSVVASMKDQGDLVLGNAIGSNLFNILAILGLTAIWFGVDSDLVTPADMALLLASALVMLPVMRSGFVIDRREGALLLVGYLGYISWLVYSGHTAGYAPI